MTKPYAAIRTENPGAQWDSKLARRFGMTRWEMLSDGNHIAVFPDHIHGAASNMALLDQKYTGRTISDGQETWSGGHRKGLPGWDGNRIITKKMMADPDFVIPFMKSIADFEAPGGAKHVSDMDWQRAFKLYRATMYGDEAEFFPIPTPRPKDDEKEVKPLSKSKTIWGGIVGAAAGLWGIINSIFESLDNKYALIGFIVALIVGAIALYLIIKGRIDVQKVVNQLRSEQ